MSQYENMRTADIVAEALLDWNVEVLFGIPGDGINGFIEALRKRKDRIRFILVRHEESAAFMACAYAKYTGKLGVCVATSGPGAIHLLNGLYDAKLDNTPVLAITGTTYSDLMNSNYQQDVNLQQLFSDVAVYNTLINRPEHAEMTVDIACRTALAHRGVSHLTIPIDVQEMKLEGNYSRHKIAGHTSDFYENITVSDMQLVKDAADILNSGKKIVILVGQGAMGAGEEVIQVAERLGAPVVKALLGKAVISDTHPVCIGGLGLLGTEPSSDAMSEADTLFIIGSSFPYIDYLPKPGQARGIQIDIKPTNIGLRFPIEIGLVGDAKLVLTKLLPLLSERHEADDTFLKSMQRSMNDWKKLMNEQVSRMDKPIKPQAIAHQLSELLDDNAIISVDCGTNTSWAARHIDIRGKMKFSLSGTLASMGCGLPYAIAAQIAFPDRQVVAFVGDGGLSMLLADFATAVLYKLPIVIVVIKNNSLGMIRWEQMAFLGNPEYGIEFSPIDFVKFAESCGGKGYAIQNPDEIKSILKLALDSVKDQNVPIIVEASVDPFEPPMPPKVEREFVTNLAESFIKGQPYSKRIGLTLFRNQIHNILKDMHTHSSDND